MKYLFLFEDFNPGDNMLSHLQGRGIDTKKTQFILDEESGDTFFFLYNLSGQMVGYQKYNPKYDKKGQDAKKMEDPTKTKYYNYVSDELKGKMIAVWGLETTKFTDKYLFITEGIFDVARAHQAGYPGIAVLCNDPSPQLTYWLKTLPQTKIVIYDNDEAGEKLRKLGDYSFSVKDGKDLNDLSEEEAKEFLDDIIKSIEN
jgi:DNA primase